MHIYPSSEHTYVVKHTDSGVLEYVTQKYENGETACLSIVPHNDGKEFTIYRRTISKDSFSHIISGCSYCGKNNFKEGLYGGYVCLSCSAPFNIQ